MSLINSDDEKFIKLPWVVEYIDDAEHNKNMGKIWAKFLDKYPAPTNTLLETTNPLPE